MISGMLVAAIYIYIWMNVVEFEWDWHSLALGFTGHIGIADLLTSLPSAVIGSLLNGFGIGTFTLLPVVTAARIIYLMAHRYLTWTGSGFKFESELLSKDMKIPLDAVTKIVPSKAMT